MSCPFRVEKVASGVPTTGAATQLRAKWLWFKKHILICPTFISVSSSLMAARWRKMFLQRCQGHDWLWRFQPDVGFFKSGTRKPRRQKDYRDLKSKFYLKIHQENLRSEQIQLVGMPQINCNAERETAIMGRWSFRKVDKGLSVIVPTGEPFFIKQKLANLSVLTAYSPYIAVFLLFGAQFALSGWQGDSFESRLQILLEALHLHPTRKASF